MCISPAYAYELFFGAKDDDDVVLTIDGIALRLDPESAQRADGLTVEWVEADGDFKIESPHEPARVRSLSARDVKKLMDAGEDFELIDVRTEGERATAKIERARHLARRARRTSRNCRWTPSSSSTATTASAVAPPQSTTVMLLVPLMQHAHA